MASVNRVHLIGNLGRDPDIKVFPSGDRGANVTIATTESWKDKQTGERKELTTWHRIVFRGGLAGIVEQYLRKGSQVYIEGSIRNRKYNDATGVEKEITEIMASEMTMLDKKPTGDQGSAPAPRPAAARPPAAAPVGSTGSGFDDLDDSIPFIDPLHHRALCLVI